MMSGALISLGAVGTDKAATEDSLLCSEESCCLPGNSEEKKLLSFYCTLAGLLRHFAR